MKRKIFIFAIVGMVMLSACGKKKENDSNQIANDFVDVQGTMTDATDLNATDEFSVSVSKGTINVKIDVDEIDNRVSKIYPAKRLVVNKQYIDSFATKLFDDGAYEMLDAGVEDAVAGSDNADKEQEDIVAAGAMIGMVNGEQYILSYNNYIEEEEAGLVDNGFYLSIMKQSEEVGDMLYNYGVANEEDCASNVCNHDDALADAESFISGLGFDDYALSGEFPLVDLEIEGERQGCGYEFVFCKEIDGSFGKHYSNDCYYKENGGGATYYEYINVYVTAENGITGVDIKNMYEIDYSDVNANVVLLGVDEAMEVAKDKITQMLLQADEMGSSFVERNELEASMVLTYVPLQYGDEIAYMPVYLFVADIYSDATEKSVLLGVSAVDGEIEICNYFYDPATTFFSPSIG